jgi:LysM repeat protein
MKKMYGSLLIIIMLFALTPTASADQVHYISKGETLTKIANQYNISLSKLMNENQYLRNPGVIFPGQVFNHPK